MLTYLKVILFFVAGGGWQCRAVQGSGSGWLSGGAVLSELAGGQAGGLFEELIEVGDGIVSAVVGDVGDGGGGADEHLAGVEDAYFIEVVEEIFVGAFFKPPAKALWGKACDGGNVLQGNIPVKIVLHVSVGFAQAVGGFFFVIRAVDVV